MHLSSSMKRRHCFQQRGVSLLEVMIAIFITAIGVLGAAALQLSALKYTDSSRLTSQASFIVYDVIDRIRANADPAQLEQYEIASLDSAPAVASSVLTTDLMDFAKAVASLPGGDGAISVDGSQVTVNISWTEGRAGGIDNEGNIQRGELAVTTHVSTDSLVAP